MKHPLRIFIMCVVFALACWALYRFVHPAAPLVLVGSVLVQAPVVWLRTSRGFTRSYAERAGDRRQAFEKTGDAAAWLGGEEAELLTPGYRYWSSAGRALHALNLAEACLAAGKREKAAAYLRDIPAKKLTPKDAARLQELRTKCIKDTAGENG